MKSEDKLQELINLCKGSVFIHINHHKDIYETVQEYLENHDYVVQREGKEVIDEMIKRDTVVFLCFSPNRTIGHLSICGYDLNMVLDRALSMNVFSTLSMNVFSS